jgi:hypothetical protein
MMHVDMTTRGGVVAKRWIRKAYAPHCTEPMPLFSQRQAGQDIHERRMVEAILGTSPSESER